jgi:hypothetical protein
MPLRGHRNPIWTFCPATEPSPAKCSHFCEIAGVLYSVSARRHDGPRGRVARAATYHAATPSSPATKPRRLNMSQLPVGTERAPGSNQRESSAHSRGLGRRKLTVPEMANPQYHLRDGQRRSLVRSAMNELAHTWLKSVGCQCSTLSVQLGHQVCNRSSAYQLPEARTEEF